MSVRAAIHAERQTDMLRRGRNGGGFMFYTARIVPVFGGFMRFFPRQMSRLLVCYVEYDIRFISAAVADVFVPRQLCRAQDSELGSPGRHDNAFRPWFLFYGRE